MSGYRTQWKEAYNRKDAGAFLSTYADKINYVEFSVPERQILYKDSLKNEVAAKFNDPGFNSRPEDFLISADGHFAAVQGTYKDQKTADTPMVIILENNNAKIIWH
ncbi:MAG TPA: hypothetical protein VMS73_05680 [Anaerolineaceae bacterium]|nr:hypothetical protein [Anaerolineaceae bacterium]